MERTRCRICLTKNVRMNWIVNTKLQHIYETLTNHALETEARPLVACYICYAQLQHCYQLSVRCLKAEEILTKIINGDQDCYDAENESLNPGKLFSVTKITQVTCFDVFRSDNTQVKEQPVSDDDDNEEINLEEVEVKCQLSYVEENEPSPEPDLCESTSQVDKEHYQTPCRSSEDELPLATLSPIQKDTNNETGHIGKDKTAATQERVPVSKIYPNTVSPGMAPHQCSSKHCFQCDIRQMSFNNKLNLISQIQTQAGEDVNSHNCKKYVEEHFQIHSDQIPYKYNMSPESFSGKGHLKSPIGIHTGDKPYNCDVCQKTFSCMGNLKCHMRKHTGDKPYKCEVCQKCYRHLSSFKLHIRMHTGEKPFKCHVCQKSFSQQSNLNCHIRLHTGDKPYKCDVCQKRFRQQSNLNSHIQIHTGDKPYKCNVCQKSFGHQSILSRHIKIHTEDKPFKCDVCQKCFCDRGNLNRHIQMHTGDKLYKCDVCQKSFRQRSNLDCHIRIHNGDKPYKCDVCQKSFHVKGNLKYHIRMHTGVDP